MLWYIAPTGMDYNLLQLQRLPRTTLPLQLNTPQIHTPQNLGHGLESEHQTDTGVTLLVRITQSTVGYNAAIYWKVGGQYSKNTEILKSGGCMPSPPPAPMVAPALLIGS